MPSGRDLWNARFIIKGYIVNLPQCIKSAGHRKWKIV